MGLELITSTSRQTLFQLSQACGYFLSWNDDWTGRLKKYKDTLNLFLARHLIKALGKNHGYQFYNQIRYQTHPLLPYLLLPPRWGHHHLFSQATVFTFIGIRDVYQGFTPLKEGQQDWAEEEIKQWYRPSKAWANPTGSSGLSTVGHNCPVPDQKEWAFTSPPTRLQLWSALIGVGPQAAKADPESCQFQAVCWPHSSFLGTKHFLKEISGCCIFLSISSLHLNI